MRALEQYPGLVEEFGHLGCDIIEWVADALVASRARVKELEKERQFVSIEDKLPACDTLCLLKCKGHNLHNSAFIGYEVGKRILDGGEFVWVDYDNEDVFEYDYKQSSYIVTHWMLIINQSENE